MEVEKLKLKKKICCSCCTSKVTIGILIPFGIVFTIFGVVLIFIFPKMYKEEVEKQLIIKNGTQAFDNWYSPPAPIYMQYYIFNYTNVPSILANHSKPSVTQVGPYVYREIRINEILDYNEYNITYLQNFSYVFDRNMSCATCSEDDIFYAPNIVVMTLIKAIHDNIDNTSYAATAVDAAFRLDTDIALFKKLTVRELLWGYTDPIIKLVKSIESIISWFGFKLPPMKSRISLQQNGTAEAELIGNLTCLTGKENINDVQKIVRWRGLDNTPYWLSKYGRMINGTDGTRAPPFLTRHQKIYIFVAELCRSLYFKYQRDVSFRDIKMYRYHTTPELFMNHTGNPDNAAFCSKNKCWGSGLLPVSQCQDAHPPIFMSSPHFYQGYPALVDAINGLKPNASLHSSYLDIEPTTGIVMRGHKRLQINVLAQKSFLTVTKPLQNDDNFLPILFVHEVAEIDSGSANLFKKQVMFPKLLVAYSQYTLIGVGIGFIFCGLILLSFIITSHYGEAYKVFIDERDTNGSKNSIYQPS